MATSTEQAQFTRRVREVVLTAVVGLFGLMTLMWALEKLRALLVLVLFSLFCGFALEPAVNKLARRGWPRGRATLAVFFLLSLVVGAFAALLGTIVVQQVTELVKSLPDYATNVADYLRRELGVDISGDDITGSTGTFSQVGKFVLGGALGIGATVLSLLFSLLTVATLTFYAAMDGPKLRRAVCRTLPPDTQREVLRAWELAIDRTAAYVSYRVVLATLSAVVHGVAFKALGVPFALSLAIWVGLVSQFIPTVGTYLAGIVPIAIALGEDPATALKVLVLILVYQQVENYVISPPLSARTMKIHPALGFVSAIGGVALIGPLGALLALPVVATVQSFLAIYVPRNRLVEDDLLSDQGGPTGDTLDEDPRAVAGDKAKKKAPAKKAPVKKAAAKKG